MKIIDPHVHLFNMEQGDYHWLKATNPPFWAQKFRIARSYSDRDLSLSDGLQLAGYVHVEAGFNNDEGHLEFAMLAEKNSLPMKAIGYIDITLDHDAFLVALKLQADYTFARGIRYIFEGRTKDIQKVLDNPNTFQNLSFLAKHKGIFELQCDAKATESVVLLFAFFNKLPELQIIINHAGFPPLPSSTGANARAASSTQAMANAITQNSGLSDDANYQLAYTNWQANILLLSQLSNVAIKFSGFEMQQLIAHAFQDDESSLSTLQVQSYTSYPISDLMQALLHCIEAFGDENLMFASNFPVCTFTHSYDQYWQQMIALLKSIPEERSINKNALIFDNALRIYGLDID
jgi:predicted TIM-barrel fold metal-dependent hydrolase